MENLIEIDEAYKSRKVLITGNTGFKGSWLTLWLKELGAHVFGYALDPPSDPSLFDLLDLGKDIDYERGDIRDFERLKKCIQRVKPDIIFHLAAQSLVVDSYEKPLETVQTNALGTANLLEAVRQTGMQVSLVLITSDKCYENEEWLFGYRETDTLGGHDPYSASKAAAENLISSWRNSFFNPSLIQEHGVSVATARAGNVIGGGDWSSNLVPHCIHELRNHAPIPIRYPYSTRPWQHVLEPLSGYLQLGARLLSSSPEDKAVFCEAFNFGPHVTNNRTVQEVVEEIIEKWGTGSWKNVAAQNSKYESALLNLSIDKAYHKLGWLPKWDFNETIARTVDWYKKVSDDPSAIRTFTIDQIRAHQEETPLFVLKLNVQETIANI